jgi:hypothetical protein
MAQEEFTLIQQVGGKGYYGKVRLGVDTADSVGITIHLDETSGNDWRVGAEFGIVYGWEIYRRHQPKVKGLSVRVLEITGKVIDTTNLVIAFVAANALWKALVWTPPKPPVFDPKTGFFSFSKY